MRLRWSHRARRDLLGIGRFIARDNAEAARRFVERLRTRARGAARHPRSGRMLPEHQRDDLRELLHAGYRIVYCVSRETVEVLTVVEGHRLLPSSVIEAVEREHEE